jgi:hypothetical protein
MVREAVVAHLSDDDSRTPAPLKRNEPANADHENKTRSFSDTVTDVFARKHACRGDGFVPNEKRTW